MAPKSVEKAKKESPVKAGAAQEEKKSPASAAKTRAASPTKLEKSPAKKAKPEEVRLHWGSLLQQASLRPFGAESRDNPLLLVEAVAGRWVLQAPPDTGTASLLELLGWFRDRQTTVWHELHGACPAPPRPQAPAGGPAAHTRAREGDLPTSAAAKASANAAAANLLPELTITDVLLGGPGTSEIKGRGRLARQGRQAAVGRLAGKRFPATGLTAGEAAMPRTCALVVTQLQPPASSACVAGDHRDTVALLKHFEEVRRGWGRRRGTQHAQASLGACYSAAPVCCRTK